MDEFTHESGEDEFFGFATRDEAEIGNAYYNAVNPANNPNSPLRTEHFKCDQLGNRHRNPNGTDNLVATKGWMHFLGRDNGLNQYTSWENKDPNPPGMGALRFPTMIIFNIRLRPGFRLGTE